MTDIKTNIKLQALTAKVAELEKATATTTEAPSVIPARQNENYAGKIVRIGDAEYKLLYSQFNPSYSSTVKFADIVKDQNKMKEYLETYPELFQFLKKIKTD